MPTKVEKLNVIVMGWALIGTCMLLGATLHARVRTSKIPSLPFDQQAILLFLGGVGAVIEVLAPTKGIKRPNQGWRRFYNAYAPAADKSATNT